MKNIILTGIIIALAGCAEDPHYNRYLDGPESYKGGNTTPTADETKYNQGMEQGCSSGSLASGNYTKQHIKNVDLYIKDAYYKSGWDDGFAKCKAQGEQINGILRDSVR